jgi:hypothetical protein
MMKKHMKDNRIDLNDYDLYINYLSRKITAYLLMTGASLAILLFIVGDFEDLGKKLVIAAIVFTLGFLLNPKKHEKL